MKRRTRLMTVVFMLVVGYLAASCQPEEVVRQVPVEVTRVVTSTISEEGETVEVTRVVMEQIVVEVPAESGSGFSSESLEETELAVLEQAETERPNQNRPIQRLIIKDGDMTLIVENTDAAVEGAIDLAVDLGGYVIEQRMWDDAQRFRHATLKLGVPVERFEEAMRSLRTFGQVTDESASGQDVTDEYVDLNSRLTNLLATQERLRSFLGEANKVSEILEINEELKEVEEELEIIQGRMTFLVDRAAVSTIDLTIEPIIPTPTPTPTATATPTPTSTPLPTPETWRPGDTAHTALVELRNTSQSAADYTIYNSITCGPWLLLTGAAGLFLWRVWRRVGRRGTPLAGEPVGGD